MISTINWKRLISVFVPGFLIAAMREIIRNTRIEVIDSIGFTAALESLVAHYGNISEKTAIAL